MTDIPDDDGIWRVQAPREIWTETQYLSGQVDPREYIEGLLRDAMRLQTLHLVGDDE